MQATLDYDVYKAFRARGVTYIDQHKMPYPQTAKEAVRSMRWKPKWDILEIAEEVNGADPMEPQAWRFTTELAPGFEVTVRVGLRYDDMGERPWSEDDYYGSPDEYSSGEGPLGNVERQGTHLNHGKTRVVSHYAGHNTTHYVFDWSENFEWAGPPKGVSRHNAWLWRQARLDIDQKILQEWIDDQWWYAGITVKVFHQGVLLGEGAIWSIEDQGGLWGGHHKTKPRAWEKWRWMNSTIDEVIEEALENAKRAAVKTLKAEIVAHRAKAETLSASLAILEAGISP